MAPLPDHPPHSEFRGPASSGEYLDLPTIWPEEILTIIFDFAETSALPSVALTCRQWSQPALRIWKLKARQLITFGLPSLGRLGRGDPVHTCMGGGPIAEPDVVDLSQQSIKSVSCTNAHTAVVTAHGHLYTFGYGKDGRLGHPGEGCLYRPTRVLALRDEQVIQVACGAEHTIALCASGRAYGFGSNHDGQVVERPTSGQPTRIPIPGPVVYVAAGPHQSAFITAEGAVWMCGTTAYEVLGHGGHGRLAPVPGLPAGDRPKAIACGCYHTLCLMGPPPPLRRPSPVADIPTHRPLLWCSESGAVWGWGCNMERRFCPARGDGPLPPILLDHLPAGDRVVQIAAGRRSSAFVLESGSCLMQGVLELAGAPLADFLGALPRGTRVAHTSLSYDHACIVTKEGEVYLWGRTSDLRLGGMPKKDTCPLVHLALPGKSRGLFSALGMHHSAVVVDCTNTIVKNGGTVSLTLGAVETGMSGTGGDKGGDRTRVVVRDMRRNNGSDRVIGGELPLGQLPMPAPAALQDLQVWPDEIITLILDFADPPSLLVCSVLELRTFLVDYCSVRRWGEADHDEVDLHRQSIKSVSCTNAHTAVVTAQGQLYTFGYGNDGRLGHGDEATHWAPTPVLALRDERVIQVACGAEHTVALCASGRAYAFGSNRSLQLGLEADGPILLPVRVPLAQPIRAVAAGPHQSAFITADGQLWMCGADEYAVTGIESSTGRTPLHPIMGGWEAEGDRPASVTCGCFHTICMTEKGALWGWGCNIDDRLAPAGLLPEKNPTSRIVLPPARLTHLGRVLLQGSFHEEDTPALREFTGLLPPARRPPTWPSPMTTPASYQVPACLATLPNSLLCPPLCFRSAPLPTRAVDGDVFLYGRDADGRLGRSGRFVRLPLPPSRRGCWAALGLHHTAIVTEPRRPPAAGAPPAWQARPPWCPPAPPLPPPQLGPRPRVGSRPWTIATPPPAPVPSAGRMGGRTTAAPGAGALPGPRVRPAPGPEPTPAMPLDPGCPVVGYALPEELVTGILDFADPADLHVQARQLRTFGARSQGRLGRSEIDESSMPGLVDLHRQSIKSLSCTNAHTAVVTAYGHLYTFGTGQDGRLGHGDTAPQWEPARVLALREERVIQVACGAEHTVALCASGRAYAFGSNRQRRGVDVRHQSGRGLGDPGRSHGRAIAHAADPGPLGADRPVMITSGESHTVLLCRWAASLVDRPALTTPRPPHRERRRLGLGCQRLRARSKGCAPQQIQEAPADASGDRVVFVTAGLYSTGILWASGRCELRGQLSSRTGTDESPLPRFMEQLPARTLVAHVALAKDHACIVTTEGEVYLYGRRDDCRLGSHPAAGQLVHLMLPPTTRGVFSALGMHHSAVVTEPRRTQPRESRGGIADVARSVQNWFHK
ncbi:putative chromosome condensation regulator RCC1 [Paratrimastix pyriformis]|uniref:Chromosome condensation regulator RCC1 n=1 Tax=Paratrimastix pyriformis TaxID=342808 RepID=A0ABQ8UHE6_9EUKA|nr:putative chromosome condensation regulator RCC1 [Paratrimastix pyriformis]